MPQTITSKTAALITCAATDLVTVTLTGSPEDMLVVSNGGPGKVYFSFDPSVSATVAGANTFLLTTGQTFSVPRIRRGSTNVFTCIADTASTMVSLLCLPTT